jgi:hypothetical protein
MAYVIPFFPADARVLGLGNNLLIDERRGLGTAMDQEIKRIIAEHSGPIFGIQPRQGYGELGFEPVQTLLTRYQVDRGPGSCRVIDSNQDASALEICSLRHSADVIRSGVSASDTIMLGDHSMKFYRKAHSVVSLASVFRRFKDIFRPCKHQLTLPREHLLRM